jgi:hypothetical protein
MVGQIRSCGCPVNDFGGLGRRATFVGMARDTSQTFLLLEGGDFFDTGINYGKQKAEVTLKSMGLMAYDGIVLGEKDFSFGVDYVLERTKALKLPVLVANLYDKETKEPVFSSSRIARLSDDLKVLLIGVIANGLNLPAQFDRERFTIGSPRNAIQRELDGLKEDADLLVVISHMSVKDARGLARDFPAIDLIVCGHEGRPMRKLVKYTNAYVLQVTAEGEYMGIAHAVLDSKKKIARIMTHFEALSKQYPDDEAVVKLFDAYDLEIALKEKTDLPAGVFDENRAALKFVGAAACKDCHPDTYEQWLDTRHSHAFGILEGENRQYDRDCTPCHTTGFYELGGFVSLARTPDLTNVQCEACHGNGHQHVQDTDSAPAKKAREACKDCHTNDQTPEFDFATLWGRISHQEQQNR